MHTDFCNYRDKSKIRASLPYCVSPAAICGG